MTSVEEFRGLHYPNKIGRLTFISLEEVMGQNGVKALLRLADLPQYLDQVARNIVTVQRCSVSRSFSHSSTTLMPYKKNQ
jgi:hypothetical protein